MVGVVLELGALATTAGRRSLQLDLLDRARAAVGDPYGITNDRDARWILADHDWLSDGLSRGTVEARDRVVAPVRDPRGAEAESNRERRSADPDRLHLGVLAEVDSRHRVVALIRHPHGVRANCYTCGLPTDRNRLDYLTIDDPVDVVVVRVRDPYGRAAGGYARGNPPTRIGGPISLPARASITLTVPARAFETNTEFSSPVMNSGWRPTWIGVPGLPAATVIGVTTPESALDTQNVPAVLKTPNGPRCSAMSVRSLPSFETRVTVESSKLATHSTLELPAIPIGALPTRIGEPTT